MNAPDSQGLPQVVFGLGSNQGEPMRTLRAAAQRLIAELEGSAGQAAGMYVSAPLGPEQPDYFNTALLVRSGRSPLELLKLAQRVEADFGRIRGERWGPRTLDIDVLCAEWVSGLPEITVPHPRLSHRAFAVLPLTELWETLAHQDRFPLPEGIYTEARVQERATQRIARICGPEWATLE